MSYKDKTRDERTSHIDLSEACHMMNACTSKTQSVARTNLRALLGVGADDHKGMFVLHLCQNDTFKNGTNAGACFNPRHVYFGTPRENNMDKGTEALRAGVERMLAGVTAESQRRAGDAGRVALAKNHARVHTCPHCGKVGKGPCMFRDHFDGCPSSPGYAPKPGPALLTCPSCWHKGYGSVMARWHFDRCRGGVDSRWYKERGARIQGSLNTTPTVGG